ncbi:MAG: hypothetical protein DK306_000077 [Chloroflexi bacterium]|jgi:hypothetical protein|nr:MAG: hypothetical protein DK306_000077 [Chloroflexota bacterium]
MSRPAAQAAAASGLRPLGQPRALQVARDASGLPAQVRFPGGATVAVSAIDQIWRIAEEWWRERPLMRTYYQLRLEDGRRLTCFYDETLAQPNGPSADAGSALGGAWFAQAY